MIQVTCIQKFKKNNRIYGYRLQDSQGNTRDVTPDQLKTAIKNQQITIINLTLTSDNRLIATTPTQQPQEQAPQISEEQKIVNLIAKSKTLGLPLKEIPTYCKHKCYLISQSPTQHLIYIPDDVTILNLDYARLMFTENIQNLQGTLKIVGGKNLQDTSNMFTNCRAKFLDLSRFNTSNILDMSAMFGNCKAQSIDLSNFNTSNVTNMNGMFSKCQAQSLDLSSFDTSKVTNMHCMFDDCEAKFIDLSNFNTSNVTTMQEMFSKCQAQSLDLSNFDTSNVTNMYGMFYWCKAQSIDLSNFNTTKVTNMKDMFYWCQVKSLDLSSFNTNNVTNMSSMLYGCEAKIKATDPKVLKAYKERWK